MLGELEKYRVFLCDYLHVDEVQHSGRNLWQHLVGTSQLLAEWGNPNPIVVAGLFHSVYGTKYFKTRSFPIEGRWIIQRLIGMEAESIVHVFCTSDRQDFLLHGGYRAMNELEMANLLEQPGDYRDHVTALLENGNLSIAARAAGSNYLKVNEDDGKEKTG